MATPKVETKIWLALKSRLRSFSWDVQVPFAYPGEAFTPEGLFIRADFTLNRPNRILLKSGPHRREGLLALVVCDVLSSAGEYSLNLAASLAEHFPVDTPFCYMDICVCVPSEPHVMGGYEDRGYWNVPVNIAWQCFA